MTTPLSLLATPDGFAAWLRSLPADAPAGHARGLLTNPLCRYLDARGMGVGMLDRDGALTVTPDGMVETEPAPAWAAAYLDALSGTARPWVPVLAGAALALLTEVCPPVPALVMGVRDDR